MESAALFSAGEPQENAPVYFAHSFYSTHRIRLYTDKRLQIFLARAQRYGLTKTRSALISCSLFAQLTRNGTADEKWSAFPSIDYAFGLLLSDYAFGLLYYSVTSLIFSRERA